MDNPSIYFKERVVINPAETKYQAKTFRKFSVAITRHQNLDWRSVLINPQLQLGANPTPSFKNRFQRFLELTAETQRRRVKKL
jgi:hypothetical protein